MTEPQKPNESPNELQSLMKEKNLDESALIALIKGIKVENDKVPETTPNEKDNKGNENITINQKDLESLIEKSISKALKGERKTNPEPTKANATINTNNGSIIQPMLQKELKQRTRN
jgi:hypothetical protein